MVRQKYKLSSYGDTKRLVGESDNLPEPILFREKLYVYDENGKRVGRFSLFMDQEDTRTEYNKILHVHISNKAIINGKLSESTVTGTVTHRLKTLEEIRYERLSCCLEGDTTAPPVGHYEQDPGLSKAAVGNRDEGTFFRSTEVDNAGKHERCMFLLRERTKYYLKVTNTICDFKSQTHTTIPFIEAIGLIGECANAVLLRKLANKGHEGILSLKTVLSNGKRCKNFYVTKLSKQVINGQLIEVLIVYRNITNHRKCNVTMTLALTRAGQIIYLFWSNSKYFLHIDPDVQISSRFRTFGEPSLHNHWHKDIQLYSLYLDGVDTQLIKNRSFKYERTELRRILSDFVEFLLLSKPKDVVCYAIQFFTAFGHNCMTRCHPPKRFSTLSLSEGYNFGMGEEKEDSEEDSQLWTGEGNLFGAP